MDLSAAECVNWYETTSNDVNEIHACLGLEAAVNVLFNELVNTISYDGTYVDPRHMLMIVNTMTRNGFVMPLSRHGINRLDTGPLLRCSFEETPDILCDAACFGENDNGKGVSQSVMTGKLPEIGSGSMFIKFSSKMLHPKDRIEQKTSNSQRILKSTIRKKENNNFEAPFEVCTPCEVNNQNDIFAQQSCLLPYSDTEIKNDTNYQQYEESTKREYKPSSPMID